ncbi:hypothetical protein ACFLU5_13900 [Bacteroidota bacterium]
MKKLLIILAFITLSCATDINQEKLESRVFNGVYEQEYLNRVAFPMGGMGAGMICLEGTGALSHVSLRHRPDIYKEPLTFSAISLKNPEGNISRVFSEIHTFLKDLSRNGRYSGNRKVETDLEEQPMDCQGSQLQNSM